MPKSGENLVVYFVGEVLVCVCARVLTGNFVLFAGVVTPHSTMWWTSPKRIAWRVSSSARRANTSTW